MTMLHSPLSLGRLAPSSDTRTDKIASGIPHILYYNVNVQERLGGNFGLTKRTEIQTKIETFAIGTAKTHRTHTCVPK